MTFTRLVRGSTKEFTQRRTQLIESVVCGVCVVAAHVSNYVTRKVESHDRRWYVGMQLTNQ